MSEDIFKEENIAQSSWMKFDKVEDLIQGTLIGRSRKEGVDKFPSQIVYELNASKVVISGEEQEPGVYNVGFPETKSFIHNRVKNLKNGQIVGFKFNEEIASKTKGYSPAKSIQVFAGGVDPDYVPNEMTDAGLKEVEENFNPEETSPFE